jgi:hypothetical protein
VKRSVLPPNLIRALRWVAYRFRVILFVLLTLALWWVFANLAQRVIDCVPGGIECITSGRSAGDSGDVASGGQRWAIMAVGFLAALWAATRVFFPPEDLDRP